MDPSSSLDEHPLTLLKLPNYRNVIMKNVSSFQWSQVFSDLTIVCQDGSIQAHRLILCSMSPNLKEILSRSEIEDNPTLILPDVTKSDMTCLLGLLYSGSVNMYKNELSGLIGLANFLKLISIPAVVVEKSWTERFPNQPDSTTEIVNSLPETASNTNSMKKKRKVLQPRKEKVPLKSKPILSTMRTRSGRKVVPKRFEDSIVDGQEDENSGENENDEPEFALTRDIQESVNEEDADDPGEKEPEVQREERSAEASNSENRASTSSGNNPHETGNSGETEIVVDDSLRVKLDDLFSVAEAIEKSQQPEFHDISKTTVPLEGTETKKLVRECLICDKQMLGRNALSRHMRNSHPKVFGPYNCPIETCSKVVESGEKMISHMQNQHKSQRAQAIAAGERFPCEQCSIVYTTKSRLNFHLRTKHGLTVGKFKPNYHCSEGDCKEVSFFTAKQFSDHMKEVHHLKPWACLKCDKRFADKQNLQFHELTHKGTKSFVCDICNAGFGNPRQLFTHRSLHLGRRFLCEDCGYRARSAANLRGHIKVKHEGKNFECELCFKKFGSNNNLKNHMRIHTGECPFHCELCNVKFKRVHHLNCHIESKIHIDMIEKSRRLGKAIPAHLDPANRAQRRLQVEEVPLLESTNLPPGAPPNTSADAGVDSTTQIIEMDSAMLGENIVQWPGGEGEQMIVITNDTGAIDSQDPNTYIIPMPEGETVEIMNEATGEHQILVPDTAQFIPVYNKFDGKQAIQIKDEMAQIQDRPSIIDSEELTQQQDPLTKQQEEGLSPSEQAGPLLQKEPGLERVVIIEKSC